MPSGRASWAKLPADFCPDRDPVAARAELEPWALLLTALCFAGLWLWPHLSSKRLPLPDELLRQRRAQCDAHPAPIVALVSPHAAGHALELPSRPSAPALAASPATCPHRTGRTRLGRRQALVTPTLTIALLGAVESLLCARVADKLAPELPRHDPNQG